MKIYSWNVNGLRACLGKGFMDIFSESKADMFCLQETKAQPHQIEMETPGYHQYFYSAERKGYSGTALFSKTEPQKIDYGIGIPEYDDEGRVITAEYGDFFLINTYTPNSGRELKRLPFRLEFEEAFRTYLKKLDEKKPIILCGDLNVAHEEIDLKNPKINRKNAGFTDEERAAFTKLLGEGFSDSFRTLYPDAVTYSWWSYMFNARANNAGWRIDYFVVSDRLMDRVVESKIHTEIMGSDHCPVSLELRDA